MPGQNSGWECAPARCLCRKPLKRQHRELRSRPVSFLFGTGLFWPREMVLWAFPQQAGFGWCWDCADEQPQPQSFPVRCQENGSGPLLCQWLCFSKPHPSAAGPCGAGIWHMPGAHPWCPRSIHSVKLRGRIWASSQSARSKLHTRSLARTWLSLQGREDGLKLCEEIFSCGEEYRLGEH